MLNPMLTSKMTRTNLTCPNWKYQMYRQSFECLLHLCLAFEDEVSPKYYRTLTTQSNQFECCRLKLNYFIVFCYCRITRSYKSISNIVSQLFSLTWQKSNSSHQNNIVMPHAAETKEIDS